MTYHLVRYYRKKVDVSKLELARLAQLTPRIIHKIEADPNYNPSRDTMVRISDALGMPPSVIFFPKEEMEKRQMFSNMIIFCMDMMQMSEGEVLKRVADMNRFSIASSQPDGAIPRRTPVPRQRAQQESEPTEE